MSDAFSPGTMPVRSPTPIPVPSAMPTPTRPSGTFAACTSPAHSDGSGSPEYQVDKLLARRWSTTKPYTFEYLIEWADTGSYPGYEPSWEPESNLCQGKQQLVDAFEKTVACSL
eukprot:6043086-Pleurochrysis_carterae.AAC.1